MFRPPSSSAAPTTPSAPRPTPSANQVAGSVNAISKQVIQSQSKVPEKVTLVVDGREVQTKVVKPAQDEGNKLDQLYGG